jgi:hypothetical protein
VLALRTPYYRTSSNHKTAITDQTTLLQLAAEITQVIDGKFQGNRLNENQPWLTITAVDSTAYDVETFDKTSLLKFNSSFSKLPNCQYC